MQTLLDGTYNLKDKTTGEIRTLKGEEAIAMTIMQTAMNSKDKNWARAVQYALQLDGSNLSPEDKKRSKEEIKLLQAKIKQINAGGVAGVDIEDLAPLAKLLNVGLKENNEQNTDNTVETIQQETQ